MREQIVNGIVAFAALLGTVWLSFWIVAALMPVMRLG